MYATANLTLSCTNLSVSDSNICVFSCCSPVLGCDCLRSTTGPVYGGDTCETEYTTDCQLLLCIHGNCDSSSGVATCTCDDASWTGDACNTAVCDGLSP